MWSHLTYEETNQVGETGPVKTSTMSYSKYFHSEVQQVYLAKVIVLFDKCCILTLETFNLKLPSHGNDGRHIDGALCY